ncbi:IucA/IucC family C-terminal-domain containing protein [Nonomuraea sp. NPDC049607]|uniref:IucA/IucC family protein n=1 Tax=Nonomuraea sp. NPDC049607 TaxID=3154732 RepID=UPI00341C3D56
MAYIDGLLPPAGPAPEAHDRQAADEAETLAVTALLNCLLREVAEPTTGGSWVLPATGHVLHVRPGRYPAAPALGTPDGPRPLSLAGLVALTEDELRTGTGHANPTLADEIMDSRDVMATLLSARRTATPPADPYLRSEQALVAGHRYHPAPKARGGSGPDSWLAYSPEVHASFALPLLGVPVEALVEQGDASALDRLGPDAPDGLALLPAHPWQVELLGGLKELRHLGLTPARAVPTASIRTVYLPEADLFCKFSLDVRITNDIRRLWLHDLRWLGLIDDLLRGAFDDLPEHRPRPAVLSDRGYRSVELGLDGGEALAVIVRDGLGGHLRPGLTALLTAGVSEGFPGNPLDGLDAGDALVWWRRYLDHVVPPVLHAYFRHGVVLECHLQNVVIGVDGRGLPGQAIFRDHEGVKLTADRHSLPGARTPVVSAAYGWERLLYCLVVNNLCEIAGAVADRHPELRAELWAEARWVFDGCAEDHGRPEELRELLTGSSVPAKANLLLRWLEADGADMRCVPMPSPLRLFTP